MVAKKTFLLSVIPLLTTVLLLIVGITYLWFVKIPELNSAVTRLNSKLEGVSADVKNKDTINSLLESSLSAASKSQSDLENRVKLNEAAVSNQQYCSKANELSKIPVDMVIHATGDDGAGSCSDSRIDYIPSSTKGALDYLQGFIKHYKDTKTLTWDHIPVVCLDDAEKAVPILEARFAQYQQYESRCNAT